jgi:thiol-disulfide isomerase/thioredoxin
MTICIVVGRWGMGHRSWGMGHGARGMGNRTRGRGLPARALVAGVALALGLSLTPRASASAQDMGIEVGTTAPAAAVQTLDGKAANLDQYVGKMPVLIEFWATWCPNCKELEPSVKALHARYGSQVRFVGVSVSVNQSPERVKLYVARHGIPGDQYFDAKGNATGAYDVPATSYVVILDRTGKVVYTGLGGDQTLEPTLKRVAGQG